MNHKKYKQLRAIIIFFVGALVAVSTVLNSYVLSIVSVATGMVFLTLVKSKAKIKVDEREKTIREKAANITYAIFAPTIGIGSLFLIMFGRDRYPYLESLGLIFAYLVCFLISLYAISYFFFNKKFGGNSDEE